jgi:hypothetical protein
MPSQVLVISFWKSPWFQAKPDCSLKQLAALTAGVQSGVALPEVRN